MSSTREVAYDVVMKWKRDIGQVVKYEQMIADIDAALQQREQKVRERCAQIAETPYGDDIRAMAGDEPRAVGQKIADAIRRPDTAASITPS